LEPALPLKYLKKVLSLGFRVRQCKPGAAKIAIDGLGHIPGITNAEHGRTSFSKITFNLAPNSAVVKDYFHDRVATFCKMR
jgi:hypothetical protein